MALDGDYGDDDDDDDNDDDKITRMSGSWWGVRSFSVGSGNRCNVNGWLALNSRGWLASRNCTRDCTCTHSTTMTIYQCAQQASAQKQNLERPTVMVYVKKI